ncbi:unnamed protein product [Rhizophagus irregularis]|nr:unnamed protein product [Rhizophagus irregularis]
MSSKKNPSNILTYIENNIICWTSANEKIDNFVRRMQLKINNNNGIVVFEWILYSQFNEIKEIGKNGSITVYSAIWKDGYPVTGDYILVQNNYIWDSENEKINDFIQERQFKINNYDDEVLEWIPYNQFNEIKVIGTNGPITVYSAIWKDAKKYPTKHEAFQVLYGISQNPDTGDYILVLTWTSGNEKIDDFIKERQLKINDHDIMLEWIPYNRFNNIKETCKNGLITVYSAIWKDGPLKKIDTWDKRLHVRDSNKIVALKCLYKSQESSDYLINEAKKYSANSEAFQLLYGISQNPDTGNYILVQNNSINLVNWISGNEIFDDFIQEMQLKINNRNDFVFEWIPYDQFNEIKETGTNGLITIYLAIWKVGPLKKNSWSGENYTRYSNKEVSLKCLHNSQESINSIINEIKKYPTKHQVLYGISQNPVTGDYILVQNNYIWNSENEKINDFIREMQLKKHNFGDIVLEWIPYNQFNEIKETGKNDLITTVYSAIWKDGPLYIKLDTWDKSYVRDSNEVVALKYLYNSQESIDLIINEAKKYYPTNHKALYVTSYEISQVVLYGISQNPVTGDYIFVFNWTSGNEKIDDFIQKERLKINHCCDGDVVFEWIPYNQFFEIKETNKNGFITVYSAIWKNGPLYKKVNMHGSKSYTRDSNNKVALKCLHNSQESIDSLINEAKKYPINHKEFQVLYGISQNPDTGNYILVQNNSINMLNWFSGNEKVDEFIQEKQLKINNYDIVPEWIPYNQFFEIKETKTNGLITVYSAIWKNGPLYKKVDMHGSKSYTRDSNSKVALKCLHNSQESIDSLINEAKKYPTNHEEFQVLYGISQNPDTGNYILVQNNSINMLNWFSGNQKVDEFIQERQLKINNYYNVVPEWIPYNQFNEIQVIDTNGFITVYSAIWKDGPLYKEIDTWDICNDDKNYARDSDKKVALICLHNSQDSIEFLLNKAKKYSIKHEELFVLYGISQNSDTNDYILIQNDPIVNIANWFNGNEKIDDFILGQ